MQKNISWLTLGILLLLCLPAKADLAPLEIHTGYWPPYVGQEGEPTGSAAEVVRLVVQEMGYQADWQYLPYSFGYRQILQGKIPLSFPYFKTGKRRKEVLFSTPLFTAISRVYYNRQFHRFDDAPADLPSFRIGRVAGYSYGERLDALVASASVYSSEMAALRALFRQEIDLLPMTEAVARQTLKEHFPDRLQLIRPVPGISDKSSLYMIAPRNAEGRALLSRFNGAYERLQEAGVLQGLLSEPGEAERGGNDLAELEVAEGFPVILGQTSSLADQSEFFAIPQGTRVLVLDWSKKIRRPAENDRVYKTMVDLSRVLVLNGPHVGKELYVKNMHIRIR